MVHQSVVEGSTKRVGFAVGDGPLAVTCTHKLLAMKAALAESVRQDPWLDEARTRLGGGLHIGLPKPR